MWDVLELATALEGARIRLAAKSEYLTFCRSRPEPSLKRACDSAHGYFGLLSGSYILKFDKLSDHPKDTKLSKFSSEQMHRLVDSMMQNAPVRSTVHHVCSHWWVLGVCFHPANKQYLWWVVC